MPVGLATALHPLVARSRWGRVVSATSSARAASPRLALLAPGATPASSYPATLVARLVAQATVPDLSNARLGRDWHEANCNVD
jgi:hypothetical protein